MNYKEVECELIEWQPILVSDWDAVWDQPAPRPGTEHGPLLLPIALRRAGSHCRPAKRSSPEGTGASCSSVLGTCQPRSRPSEGLGTVVRSAAFPLD